MGCDVDVKTIIFMILCADIRYFSRQNRFGQRTGTDSESETSDQLTIT